MKRIFTVLCALAIVMAGSATALAADASNTGQSASYYPISVEEYTYGDFDELRINKVYQLSLADDPSLIPTEDFTRNGRHYYLLDMTRKDEVGVDIQTHTETVTQASDTNNLEKLFGDGKIIDSPSYSGRSCFGTLGKNLRVRAQFVTSGHADHPQLDGGLHHYSLLPDIGAG